MYLSQKESSCCYFNFGQFISITYSCAMSIFKGNYCLNVGIIKHQIGLKFNNAFFNRFSDLPFDRIGVMPLFGLRPPFKAHDLKPLRALKTMGEL